LRSVWWRSTPRSISVPRSWANKSTRRPRKKTWKMWRTRCLNKGS
jgi:hypothetical protein